MTTKGLNAPASGNAAFGQGPGGRVCGHMLPILASQPQSISPAPSPALSHEGLSFWGLQIRQRLTPAAGCSLEQWQDLGSEEIARESQQLCPERRVTGSTRLTWSDPSPSCPCLLLPPAMLRARRGKQSVKKFSLERTRLTSPPPYTRD